MSASDSDGRRNEPSYGPAPSAQLAHGVATRRPGEQLALGFIQPHFFSVTIFDVFDAKNLRKEKDEARIRSQLI